MSSADTLEGNSHEHSEELDRDPSKPLFKFELKLSQKLREMKEGGASRAELKSEIRTRWLKLANKLNLDASIARFASMYFFRLLNENPQRAAKQWQLLHELAQNAINREKANEIINQLLVANQEGVTLLCRLVKGIVKGDYYVGVINYEDENIYYLFPPGNSEEIYKDKKRHEVRDSIEDKFKGKVIEKPIPDNYESASKMNPQDRSTFLKIYQYLQSDADTLIFSTSWQQHIERYFRGIENHLLSTLRCLPVKQAKSDARKERYRKFIHLVVSKYLNRLRSFCLTMANSSREQNTFASDILFESHLITNNTLKENTIEPPHTSIEKKWSLLFREIEQYVSDDATIMMMTAITPKVLEKVESGELTAEEFDAGLANDSDRLHPRWTGEINPEMVDEVRSRVAKHEAETAQAQTAQAAQAVVAASVKKSDPLKKTVIFHGLPQNRDTPMGIPAIKEAPQGQLVKSSYKGLEKKCLETASIEIKISKSPIIELSGSIGTMLSRGNFAGIRSLISRTSPQELLDHEDFIKAHLTSTFRKLPRSVQYELSKTEGRNDLLRETSELIDNYALTPNLRRELLNELITYFEFLLEKNSFYKKYLYDILIKLIHQIGDGVELPPSLQNPHKLLKTVKKKETLRTKMPQSAEIDAVSSSLPNVQNKKVLYADLKARSAATEADNDEAIIRHKLINEYLYAYGVLKSLRKRCSEGLVTEEAFIAAIKEIEQEIIERLTKLKRFKVGFIGRHFSSNPLTQEKVEYYDESIECIEKIWKDMILPTILTYGKVALLSPKETTA